MNQFVRELLDAGTQWMQYRNKSADSGEVFRGALQIAGTAKKHGCNVKLIMNDRADFCLGAALDGVHVGQQDLSAEGVRRIVGEKILLGVSTHSLEQIIEANSGPADYIAFGPVFRTSSKANPDPVLGLAGVRAARALTARPLVAIGGVTAENCTSIIDAGADSVAVLSGLLASPRKSAEDFLRRLG